MITTTTGKVTAIYIIVAMYTKTAFDDSHGRNTILVIERNEGKI